MRVLVAGDPDFGDPYILDIICAGMKATHNLDGDEEVILIHVRESTGVGHYADITGRRNKVGKMVFRGDPDDGRAAKAKRDARMFAEGKPQMVLIFSQKARPGPHVRRCAALAEEAGVPTYFMVGGAWRG